MHSSIHNLLKEEISEMSQYPPNVNSNASEPYVPNQPTSAFPTPPPHLRTSRYIVLLTTLVLVLVGGMAFGLVNYNNTRQGYDSANATATAFANATVFANATTTAQAVLTSTAIASSFPFSADLRLNDPLRDNINNNGWETSQFCKFQGNAYHAVDPQKNTFTSCSAVNTNFTNFTFEVEASLVSGDGLGIVFRGDAAKTQYYRFAIYNDGSYGVYVYVDPTAGNTRTLKTGNLAQTPTLSNTNTIAVVARGTTMTLYFNQTEVVTVTDSTYTHGQIGVATTDLSKPADAVFSNAKVWALP